ncbi:MAG TPA: SDR family oxidoreductase [Methylomirabilota bacterium]|nr:SDR family oxidoreductase [Methylomirabilota bacterium]
MSRPFEGRVAVVTGGSRGIGRGIALRLARDGAHCVITYRRDADTAAQTVAALEALGVSAFAERLELAEPEQVGAVFERIAAAFGRVDVLVANAAATAFRPMLEQKPHNVRRTFAISVDAFVAMAQAAVPLMAGRPGRIVLVSGIDSFQAMGGHGVLGAAKAAAEALVRGLALELGPLGVTVNAVTPGFVKTDSSTYYVTQGLGLDYERATARLLAATPVRRHGTPEDVAALVAYLASEAASFLTGQCIVIDGGLTITSPLARMAEEGP